MTLKRLLLTLALVIAGMCIATALHDVLFYIILKPTANALVEAQLDSSNAAPVASQLFHTFGWVLLWVVYLILAAVGLMAGWKFYKERKY